MGFVKGITRFAVVGTVLGVGTAFVAHQVRPGSVGAFVHNVGHAVGEKIDQTIDETSALRSQIRQLEAEYPKKIAEVRTDLDEVNEQISYLERELGVSEKVVALIDADLGTLDTGIRQARAITAEKPYEVVRIRFDGDRINLDEAYTRRTSIERTKTVHQTRIGEFATELSYLDDQQTQLVELLSKLEQEQAQFQAQLVQLDAQIDSIARNERMIAMMEDRQKTIDAHKSYKAHSLDQLTTRLANVRSEQQERMAQIAHREAEHNYVDEARYLLDAEGAGTTVVEPDAGAIEWETESDLGQTADKNMAHNH
ncbi:MAG: hypothetical protein AAGI17_11235 [Planctomycetota bacterium]